MLKSMNGKFILRMQMDGNLVVKENNTNIKTKTRDSKTQDKGCPPFSLKMQMDNKLCIYDGNGTRIWASRKSGSWATIKVYHKI